MPRRRVVERRDVMPDPVYNSPLVTKFINGIMWDGKKSTAEGIFYNALLQMGEKLGEDPLKIFKRAIANVRPTSSRRAGRRLDLPSADRGSQSDAFRSQSAGSAQRRAGGGEKTMTDRLAGELSTPPTTAATRSRKRKTAPHGRGQQGLRALQMVEKP